MEPLITKINHIGIVTKDVRAMMKRYEEVYGVTGWTFLDGEKGFDPSQKARNLTVRGVRQDYEISLAQTMIGDVRIELIQPLDDNSDFARFLKEKGEGVHHIGIDADQARMPDAMERSGVPELLSGTIPEETHFVYYDTLPQIGMTVEVCYPPEPVTEQDGV